MKMALINLLESAWQNYTNFGVSKQQQEVTCQTHILPALQSDTGGYRSGTRTAEVLIRWAQLNAFLPLFENGTLFVGQLQQL